MEERKMDETQFEAELMKRIRKNMGANVSIHVETMQRNNSQKSRSLVIRNQEENLAPAFHIHVYYQAYLEGAAMHEIVEEICRSFREEMKKRKVDLRDFTDWERVKSQLRLRAISTDQNGALLECSVHREILDLSAVVYARIYLPGRNGIGSIGIRKEHLGIWDQSAETVYEQARQNTVREGIVFENLTHLVRDKLHEMGAENLQEEMPSEEAPRFVLTNEEELFGAVYMLIPEIMDQIADEKGGDVYVLPSSVNEVMILPVTAGVTAENLQAVVQDINEMQVPLEQTLSNRVYRYSRETGLQIVA